MTDFFKDIAPLAFEGADSSNEFAFRHYDPTRW
jgi:xylose isomerase